MPANPRHTFFGDVPEVLASQAVATLSTQSMKSFTSPSPSPAWADPAFAGHCAYVLCSKDNALPPMVQDMMLKLSGIEWIMERMPCSHSPFLSCPEELAEFIVEMSQVFLQ